jgi:hypothetical protein
MLRSSIAALLMILLAAPASAASRAGGGFHGGFHGGGLHGGSIFHGGGGGVFRGGGGAFHDGGGFHGGAAAFAFRRGVATGLGLAGVYGYGYGYNCGFGFDCGVYGPGFGAGLGLGYGAGLGYGYGAGAGNAVTGSSDLSTGSGYSGGYVPDPEGADIPPTIFPTPCWVRRNGYDPSGAYVGQVLIDLCRPSDSVTVTRADARAKPPNAGKGTGQPAPADRSGPPQSPPPP